LTRNIVLVILASCEDTMSILTRPRPPCPDLPPDAEALEALIEEARRRARRRRRGYAAFALSATAAGLLAFYGFSGSGSTSPSEGAGSPANEAVIAPQVRYGKWRPATGLEGGAITALALDPNHPRTIFAATLEAGVFKSSNGGGSWRALDIAPDANRVDALALAPRDPRTIYVGTGGGIFKSMDGGATWLAVNSGLFGDETAAEREHRLLEGFVYALAIDQTNQDVVYAATWEGGLLKTSDGGGSWQSIGLKALQTVVVDPANSEVVYAGAAGAALRGAWSNSGVLKSSDGGATWHSAGLHGMNVEALTLDPQDPETLYASTYGRGIFKTEDGGASWHGAGLEGQQTRGLILDPKNPDSVYAQSKGRILATTDGGGTWRTLNSGWVSGTWPTAFALDPRNPATIYLGTITAVDGRGDVGAGLFKSLDGGHSWRPINAGLTDARVTELALDPRNPRTAYAGIDGRGVYKRVDGRWQAANAGLTSEGVHAVALDTRDPASVYAGTDGGVFKSTNGGASWERLEGFRTNVSALAIDPQRSETVYAIAGEKGVFKSTDAGATWRRVARSFGTDADTGVLAVDPDRDIVYAGGVGLLKSSDGGATWQSAGLMRSTVYGLALDPEEPATLYAGTDAGLYMSADAGGSWRSLGAALEDVPVEAVAIDSRARQTMYAGTDRGVFMSTNAGHSWRRLGGLPLRTFDALAIVASRHRVYAGAYGGGIFDLRHTR
jgi:photosystem II stability/assembly factor-like uncharacterized protein